MPEFSELDYLLSPTDADARTLADARTKALKKRRPAALALALTPEAGARAVGSGMLDEEEAAQRRLGELARMRWEQQQQRAAARRAQEQLQLQREEAQFRREPAYQAYTSRGGEPMVFNPRAGSYARPFGPGGVSGPPPPAAPAMKPLTEAQARANQQLHLARNAIEELVRLGPDVMPRSGAAGAWEGFGQAARARGVPQLLSAEAQRRHSALLSVTEPVARALTGAAAPVEEVIRLTLEMTPLPGEAPPEQRAKLRRLVENSAAAIGSLPPGPLRDDHVEFYQNLAAWVNQVAAEAPTTTQRTGVSTMQRTGTLDGRRVFQR